MVEERPYKLLGGWYALLVDDNCPHPPARGPFRTDKEIQGALARWLHRIGKHLPDLRAYNPELVGPYRTRANAAAARKEHADRAYGVDRQPLLHPRGGWPRGKARNNPIRPNGWDSVEDFLTEFGRWCRDNRKTRALARELGVSPMTPHRWFNGEDNPPNLMLQHMVTLYKEWREEPCPT